MDISVFAERLKQARQKKDLNYKQLSEISGVTSTALSNYEKGDKMPNLESAAKIAAALGVSIDWLCGIENVEKGDNNNINLLSSLMVLLDKLPFETGYSEIYNEFPVFIKFDLTLFDKLVAFADEYRRIQEIKNTNLATDEMISTLLHNLIEKYKDVSLSSDDFPV